MLHARRWAMPINEDTVPHIFSDVIVGGHKCTHRERTNVTVTNLNGNWGDVIVESLHFTWNKGESILVGLTTKAIFVSFKRDVRNDAKINPYTVRSMYVVDEYRLRNEFGSIANDDFFQKLIDRANTNCEWDLAHEAK